MPKESERSAVEPSTRIDEGLVAVEEATAIPQTPLPSDSCILLLSAENPAALDAKSAHLADFLASATAGMRSQTEATSSSNSDALANVAYTLQTECRHFPCRRFIVCNDPENAVASLKNPDPKNTVSGSKREKSERPVIFLFPGIGDHYVGMGQGLYEHFEVFRREIDRCAEILLPLMGLDVRDLLYPRDRVRKPVSKSKGIDLKRMLGHVADEQPDAFSQKLDQTIHCHPALFAVEYALARLWFHLGVAPDYIVGHSMGEYVAGCLAGVFSLEDALRLVAFRAQLVNELPCGSMLAVLLSEDKLLPLLGEELSISLINGPNLCVVAGSISAMTDFQNKLKERGIVWRPVRNAHAFHSRMLDPIVAPFTREVKKISLNIPRIPFISNVTGTWITAEQATNPGYWVDHARSTARFSDALGELWSVSNCLPLEAGPGRTLGVLAMQHPGRTKSSDPQVLSSLRHDYENQPDADLFLGTLGRLWLAGIKTDWEKLEPRPGRRKISLPEWDDASTRPSEPKFKTDSTTDRASSTFENSRTADRDEMPSTPAEIALAKIWSEALELKQIGLHDNFFDLGGHSLQAMRVIVQVHQCFGKSLPVESLFMAPTVFQFSTFLDENHSRKAVDLSNGLRGRGRGAPLFWIPLIEGFGFIPPALARNLSEGSRFYDGLQYPGFNRGESMPRSIEEIAAHLIPQIQKIWPNGPYYLLGWSFGGMMAFEVARQLEAMGAEVRLVLLLDSRCPAADNESLIEGLRKRSTFEIVDLFRNRLSRLSHRERAIFFRDLAVNKFKFLLSSFKGTAGVKPENDMTPIMEASVKAARLYRPGSYGGRVVLFQIQIENWEFYSGFRYAPDSTFGWGKWVRGGMEVLRVPGDHLSIVIEPAASKVAEMILKRLRQDTAAEAIPSM